MSSTPSPNGLSNGRLANGRFGTGNPGGPGNPDAANAAKRRAEFWRAIRSSDVRLAIRTIRRVLKSKSAKDGDKLAAARELLDRTIGKSVASDWLERLEAIEDRLGVSK